MMNWLGLFFIIGGFALFIGATAYAVYLVFDLVSLLFREQSEPPQTREDPRT